MYFKSFSSKIASNNGSDDARMLLQWQDNAGEVRVALGQKRRFGPCGRLPV
jgi:hypothetical protein